MLRVIISLVFCCFSPAVRSQWQIGFSGGMAHYEGDLTDRIYVGPLTKGMVSGHLRYELTPRIMVRGALSFAKVAGADQYSRLDYLRRRNLSFESSIYEASLVAEVHTFKLEDRKFSPYLFGGTALFHFNPYTFDTQGQLYYLQPLSTEGQGLPGYGGKPYPFNQWAMLYGGGFRFSLSRKVLLGAEVGIRRLFTDYLDDVSSNYAAASDLIRYRGPAAASLAYREDEVPGGNPNYPLKGSQRGGNKYRDYYYFSGISVSFRLGAGRFGRDSRRSVYGCPTVF